MLNEKDTISKGRSIFLFLLIELFMFYCFLWFFELTFVTKGLNKIFSC